MTETKLLTASEMQDEVRKITSLISTARRFLAEDRMIDLAALEGKVQALCDSIHRAAPEDVEGLGPPVAAIIDDLDGLEADLARQYETLTAGHEEAVRPRAVDAYRRATDEA